MKAKLNCNSARALTAVDVLVAIFVVFVILGVLLPALARNGRRPHRINCISNLKQIALAMRMWSNDHGEKFPWQVPVATNGTLELAESPQVFRHFLAISNELVTPKILACSTDKKVSRESDWAKMNNSHLSYFVGLEADESIPQSILSGDRNLTGGTFARNGILRFGYTNQAGWGPGIHKDGGNIALGDGSAHQVTVSSMQKQLQSAFQSMPSTTELRFSIPRPD